MLLVIVSQEQWLQNHSRPSLIFGTRSKKLNIKEVFAEEGRPEKRLWKERTL